MERHQLYMGGDHLLMVVSEGFTEFYKRFFFRDIQAIIVNKTGVRAAINWLLLLGVLLTILLGVVPLMFVEYDRLLLALPASFLVIFLGWMLINTLRGPTCRVYLRTAVQTEHLASLTRIARAGRVIDAIRTKVEAAQGTLAPEQISLAQERMATPEPARQELPVATLVTPVQPTPAWPEQNPALAAPRPYRSRAHGILFILWMVNLVHSILVLILGYTSWLLGISILLGVVIIATMIVALVKQTGSTLPGEVKRLTWISAIYFIVIMAVSIVAAIAQSIANPFDSGRDSISVFDSPFELTMLFIDMLCSACFAYLGISSLSRFMRRQRMPPEIPAATTTDQAGEVVAPVPVIADVAAELPSPREEAAKMANPPPDATERRSEGP